MIHLSLQQKAFEDEVILGPLEFNLQPGERAAILGPSGIGKSTLLRIIAGLDPRFEGTRRLQGQLAMVFQEPTLLPWRDAVQNITLITGVGVQKAQDVLAEVGLAGKETQFPGQLSLGQQRRLSLARALAADPEILILDEPFASLDEQVAEEMMALTAGLIKDRSMSCLLVTHSQREARAIADHILRLDGAPAQLNKAS